MSKIVGLTYPQYVALGRLIAGRPVKPEMQRHFELKGWFRGGQLTEDGRYVWKRALLDPPERRGLILPDGSIVSRSDARPAARTAPSPHLP